MTRPRDYPLASQGASGECGCGKVRYTTRRAANAAIRRHHTGDHLRPYTCPRGHGGWHVGHLPRIVMHGEATASDIYERSAL